MAQLIYSFDVVVNPGASATAPNVYPLSMPPIVVVSIEIVIPDGNKGAVHFALGSAGTRVIPYNAGAYLTGNAEVIRWPVEGYINSGSWQMHAFNTGSFPHTLQVRFLGNLPGTPAAQLAQPFAASLLGG